ncbi:class I SAM-dependent methyltransferase [Luteolibacter sp. LG18]|uniref:class I SAM-dependent methyltransferase n=1 Tax=Luteolibacter sp. LG18 TaxID=2819286 RepID=UPI0030C70B38
MNKSHSCRSCGSSHLRRFLDLGNQPLANNLPRPDDALDREPRFPLRVAVCESCRLVQIEDTVPPVTLFGEYLYFSSFSDAMVRHAAEAVVVHTGSCNLGVDSFVVEIASNDGYLLKNFVSAGIPCLGVEPAANIAEVAVASGVPTLCEFFGVATSAKVVAEYGQADLILGNNVFAHAPDINDFIGGMAGLLKSGGRIVLEFPYLGNFIDNIEFDTVYHEHVFYFSVLALAPAFARHGLEIFDVTLLDIHGGSLRLSVGHAGVHEKTVALQELVGQEKAAGMDADYYYDSFSKQVEHLRTQLVELVGELKEAGHSLAAYGASAKGSTLLNFFGIGQGTLDFVADRSTYKQGRLTPGTHLPIVPPEALLERMPDYTLLLTWNFAKEILLQQDAYRKAGGKFIIPLPEPTIV